MDVQEKGQAMSSLGHCSRWLLVMLSILELITGAVVAGLGLYFLLQQNDVSVIMGHVFMTLVAAMVVAAGLLMILCALCGIVGSLLLSRVFILMFISMLSLICVLLLGGAVMALVFKSELDEEVRAAMSKSLKNYGDIGKTEITHAWDRTQENLYCCGVDEQSWPEYKQTPWYKQTPVGHGAIKPLVPDTCCVRNQYGEFINKEKCQFTVDDPPGVKTGARNEALHYQGCFTAARRHGDEYFEYATGIGFGVLVVMVISLVVSIVLLNQLRK